jgi:hypothetical protein
VLDDVAGDFFRQRKGKSHKLFYGNNLGGDFREQNRRIRRRRVSLQKMTHSRQQKIQGRNALAGIDAGAARAKEREQRRDCQPQKSPL